MDALTAIETFQPPVLIWSWPVPKDESGRALARFDGESLIYIGEHTDGCTGGPLFHELLSAQYLRRDNYYIPSFPGVRDHIGHYTRTPQ